MASRNNPWSWGTAISMVGFVLLGILLLLALRNGATPCFSAVFVVIGAVWLRCCVYSPPASTSEGSRRRWRRSSCARWAPGRRFKSRAWHDF